jgi:hypothetical protein
MADGSSKYGGGTQRAVASKAECPGEGQVLGAMCAWPAGCRSQGQGSSLRPRRRASIEGGTGDKLGTDNATQNAEVAMNGRRAGKERWEKAGGAAI